MGGEVVKLTLGYTARSARFRVCVTMCVACGALVFLFLCADMFPPLAGPLLLMEMANVGAFIVCIVQAVILVPMIFAFGIVPRWTTAILSVVGLVGWFTWGITFA